MHRTKWILAAILVLAVGGCGGDIAKQIVSNEQLRTQVLDTIAAHKDIAMQTVERLIASDSLRAAVVDDMLHNDKAAQQVLVRIGTNPGALDLVMTIAARDSTLRAHIVTFVHGIEAVSGKK